VCHLQLSYDRRLVCPLATRPSLAADYCNVRPRWRWTRDFRTRLGNLHLAHHCVEQIALHPQLTQPIEP
jgi:hypothetical protein